MTRIDVRLSRAPCKFGTLGIKRIMDHSLQHAGNRWHLVTMRARSGDDHNRGRRAGAQFDVVRNLLDAHHDRYALREPDPLEGRLDGKQQLEACAAVLLGNAPADVSTVPGKGVSG
jgi:hypothetical protein